MGALKGCCMGPLREIVGGTLNGPCSITYNALPNGQWSKFMHYLKIINYLKVKGHTLPQSSKVTS